MSHQPDRLNSAGGGREQETRLSLLQGLLANNPDDWHRFVHLYKPFVYHWCNRGGVRGADADDAWQEVCRAVAAGVGKFHWGGAGGTFGGWLRVITRNVIALHYRQGARRPQASGGTGAYRQLQDVADPQADLPEEGSPGERDGLYRRALELMQRGFEEKTWRMVLLTVVEGQAPADVAAHFGVTPAAVRKAKSKVLHRLRTQLGHLITSRTRLQEEG
jgi:RNA polymerase sigma-70 factor (ECF subfamily)